MIANPVRPEINIGAHIRGAARPRRGSRTRLLVMMGVLIASAFASGTSLAQTIVSLRGAVRLGSDAPLKVSDLAVITGDDAERIGTLVVAEKASGLKGTASGNGWMNYSLQDLRSFLEENKVNLGRTTLRGSTCSVRLPESATETTAIRAGVAVVANAKVEPTNVEFNGPATVRHSIASAVARHLNVEPEDLRLAFEAKDGAFIDQASGGKRVDVQPAAAAANEVLPLRVYIYQKERLVGNQMLSVRALVRREQVTASQTIERRTVIDETMLARGEAWVTPSTPVGVTMDEAVGTVARNRVGVGQVLTRGAIELPILIKKGDKTEVHCLSGTVTLKALRARALSDGREGEYIQFQVDGSKRTFSARVSGRGLAITSVGAQAE